MVGMAAGVAATMVFLAGCSSKEHQLANVAGANGFLGSRGVVPPPYSSPTQLKDIPAGVPAANVQGEQDVSPIAEPTLADEDNVLGQGGRLASIVTPSTGTAPASNAVVPPPMGSAINTAPLIQDLSTGKNTAVTPTPADDVLTMPNGVQAGDLTYMVKKGDTLSSIARMYSVQWENIAIINGINKSNPSIRTGQILKLPANAVLSASPVTTADAAAVATIQNTNVAQQPAATTRPAATTTTPSGTVPVKHAVKPLPADGKYVVVAGDSLWKIGHKYGISAESILIANNLTSDKLSIGQVLILRKEATTPKPSVKPADTGKPAGPNAAAKPTKDTTTSMANGLPADKHIVKSGDNIWTLARKYKVSEKDIWQWNNLKSSNLRIGQVLIVRKPGNAAATPTQPGIPAVVPAADDSQKTALPSSQPTTANAAQGAVVEFNQPAANANAQNGAAISGVFPHTVLVGETLAGILKDCAITIEQFKQLNPSYKEGEELKPGEKIMIPPMAE